MKLDEFIALPEDNPYRYELQEGVLRASPLAPRKHQLAAYRLAHQN
jgi:Uma2 family endonuclease